jgi:hypothetical protein
MNRAALVPVTAVHSRRLFLCLLAAYPVLALAGAFTHWQACSVAAVGLLFALLLWPALSRGRVLAWLLWLALLGGIAWLAQRGLATLALQTVPVLVSGLIAWLFGRTLRRSRQPLVARVIEAVEGAPRLAQPGVARYARQLTWGWALLLGAQACALLVLLACAVPGGLLWAMGVVPPLALSARWALGYVQVGGYGLLLLAFAGEYAFRRWHLRHLQHLGLREFMARLVSRWPQLARAASAADAGQPTP